MSLNFNVIAHKKPGDINAPEKYYPRAQSSGESDFRSLAKQIQKHTGQSYADVIGVLAAFEDVIPEELREGKIVRLGSIGSLYTTLKTVPGDSLEEVTSKNIMGLRIRFRPARQLLTEVNAGAQYKKVSVAAGQETGEEV